MDLISNKSIPLESVKCIKIVCLRVWYFRQISQKNFIH